MISFLRGKIIYKNSLGKKGSSVILDVANVGYEISVTLKTLEKLKEGDETSLYTYLYVREDAMELFGFLTKSEIDFFKLLITISGIGPKSALNILEHAEINDMQEAVIQNDPQLLTKTSGLSQKTSEKIVLGLKDHFKIILESKVGTSGAHPDMEVIEVLLNLGFSPDQARRVLSQISPEKKSAEDRIKEALKILGKRR